MVEKIETKQMNIYEKMSAITNELTRVAKNLNVGVGKSQYKAVGEADVLAAIKPVEEKYRVYSYPFNRRVIDTNVLTTTSTYNGEVNEKNSLFLRIETTYRFVNIDNPSEYIDVITYGDGVDSQDKAPGKAMTYADKYALLKAYKVETGDDPDQHKSEDLKRVAKRPTEEQIDRLELESHCAELGIDLKEPSIANFIRVNLAKSSGREELDEKFNLGQYNNILAKLIERKTSNK